MIRPYWLTRLSYWLRPFDVLADRRRWRWQPRQQCATVNCTFKVSDGWSEPAMQAMAGLVEIANRLAEKETRRREALAAQAEYVRDAEWVADCDAITEADLTVAEGGEPPF